MATARRTRRRQSSGGPPISRILLGSTAAGFGLGAGRSAYRRFEKSFGTLLVLALLLGTGYAVWDMVRGHRRGPVATVFVTFLFNVLVIAISISASFLALAMLTADAAAGILLASALQGILALGGLSVGLYQRRSRMAVLRVDRDNDAFMAANGLREVGGDHDTWLDAHGNELKLEDERLDALVFRVQGRRAVRAYVRLNADGRMVSYEAPQRATA